MHRVCGSLALFMEVWLGRRKGNCEGELGEKKGWELGGL